jgi:hypothetical protein
MRLQVIWPLSRTGGDWVKMDKTRNALTCWIRTATFSMKRADNAAVWLLPNCVAEIWCHTTDPAVTCTLRFSITRAESSNQHPKENVLSDRIFTKITYYLYEIRSLQEPKLSTCHILVQSHVNVNCNRFGAVYVRYLIRLIYMEPKPIT